MTKRLISTLPSTTDSLRLLGVADWIVGADRKSVASLGANVENLGEVDNLNIAKIIALKPDLVVATDTIPGSEATIHSLLAEGVAVLSLHSERFDDVIGDLYTIGVECGLEDKARPVVDALSKRQRERRRLTSERMELVPCYVELWPNPFVTIGSQNWISDMLHQAGGINIFQDVANPTFWPEEEEIFARAPEAMFVLWRDYGDDVAGFDIAPILARQGWANVPAVKRRRIVALPESLFVYPGPKLFDGLDLLIQQLASA